MATSLAVAGLLGASPSSAAPADPKARQGLAAAKKGDCVKAVPLLEDAELAKHTPTTAFALAKCYVALGELVRASELFHAVADEPRARSWTRTDIEANKAAAREAQAVDARIPTLAFELPVDYPDLTVTLDGKSIGDPTEPRKVTADVAIVVEAEATGYERLTRRIVLAERERRVVRLELVAVGSRAASGPPAAEPTYWLGARFRGLAIPQSYQNLFGDGGQSLVVPGGGATLMRRGKNADVTFSLGYADLSAGPMPWKATGAPDTDWEIVESDLQALLLTVDVLWGVPLDDDGDITFRIGGGAGLGWTFAGDLKQTQAYFPKGASGDTTRLKKCLGPDDPVGSYRYCNQLDADADHYGGYTSPGWFDDGYRPTIFPWLALPQLGLSLRVSRRFVVDLETALTLTGVMFGAGWRVGL